MIMHATPLDQVLDSMRKDALKQRSALSGDVKGILDSTLTIDNFFDLLYDLFKSNNLLVEDQQNLNGQQFNKFVFTEEYPDQTNTAGNIVTFEISRRAPASMGQGEKPFQGTKHYRPALVHEESDKANNDIKLYFSNKYDNLITLVCWSTHARAAREMAALIESIINTAYYFIRRKVPVFVFEGRQSPIFTDRYGDKRLVGIPLQIFVRTDEISIVKAEELEHMPEVLCTSAYFNAQISTGV